MYTILSFYSQLINFEMDDILTANSKQDSEFSGFPG